MSSRFIEDVVQEVKNQGVFDELRKDSLADLDSLAAYQNLRNRVDSAVKSFLSEQKWTPETNKFQLREKLRRHIVGLGFLDAGVARIVDKVIEPKIAATIEPNIERIGYKYYNLPVPERPPLPPTPPPPPPKPPAEPKLDLLDMDLEQISADSSLADDNELNEKSSNKELATSKLAADDARCSREQQNQTETGSNKQQPENIPQRTITPYSELSRVSSDSRMSLESSNSLASVHFHKQTRTEQADANISEEAQMPKFNENSSEQMEGQQVQFNFNIQKNAIKFEGTGRRTSVHGDDLQEADNMRLADVNSSSSLQQPPTPCAEEHSFGAFPDQTQTENWDNEGNESVDHNSEHLRQKPTRAHAGDASLNFSNLQYSPISNMKDSLRADNSSSMQSQLTTTGFAHNPVRSNASVKPLELEEHSLLRAGRGAVSDWSSISKESFMSSGEVQTKQNVKTTVSAHNSRDISSNDITLNETVETNLRSIEVQECMKPADVHREIDNSLAFPNSSNVEQRERRNEKHSSSGRRRSKSRTHEKRNRSSSSHRDRSKDKSDRKRKHSESSSTKESSSKRYHASMHDYKHRSSGSSTHSTSRDKSSSSRHHSGSKRSHVSSHHREVQMSTRRSDHDRYQREDSRNKSMERRYDERERQYDSRDRHRFRHESSERSRDHYDRRRYELECNNSRHADIDRRYDDHQKSRYNVRYRHESTEDWDLPDSSPRSYLNSRDHHKPQASDGGFIERIHSNQPYEIEHSSDKLKEAIEDKCPSPFDMNKLPRETSVLSAETINTINSETSEHWDFKQASENCKFKTTPQPECQELQEPIEYEDPGEALKCTKPEEYSEFCQSKENPETRESPQSKEIIGGPMQYSEPSKTELSLPKEIPATVEIESTEILNETPIICNPIETIVHSELRKSLEPAQELTEAVNHMLESSKPTKETSDCLANPMETSETSDVLDARETSVPEQVNEVDSRDTAQPAEDIAEAFELKLNAGRDQDDNTHVEEPSKDKNSEHTNRQMKDPNNAQKEHIVSVALQKEAEVKNKGASTTAASAKDARHRHHHHRHKDESDDHRKHKSSRHRTEHSKHRHERSKSPHRSRDKTEVKDQHKKTTRSPRSRHKTSDRSKSEKSRHCDDGNKNHKSGSSSTQRKTDSKSSSHHRHRESHHKSSSSKDRHHRDKRRSPGRSKHRDDRSGRSKMSDGHSKDVSSAVIEQPKKIPTSPACQQSADANGNISHSITNETLNTSKTAATLLVSNEHEHSPTCHEIAEQQQSTNHDLVDPRHSVDKCNDHEWRSSTQSKGEDISDNIEAQTGSTSIQAQTSISAAEGIEAQSAPSNEVAEALGVTVEGTVAAPNSTSELADTQCVYAKRIETPSTLTNEVMDLPSIHAECTEEPLLGFSSEGADMPAVTAKCIEAPIEFTSDVEDTSNMAAEAIDAPPLIVTKESEMSYDMRQKDNEAYMPNSIEYKSSMPRDQPQWSSPRALPVRNGDSMDGRSKYVLGPRICIEESVTSKASPERATSPKIQVTKTHQAESGDYASISREFHEVIEGGEQRKPNGCLTNLKDEGCDSPAVATDSLPICDKRQQDDEAARVRSGKRCRSSDSDERQRELKSRRVQVKEAARLATTEPSSTKQEEAEVSGSQETADTNDCHEEKQPDEAENGVSSNAEPPIDQLQLEDSPVTEEKSKLLPAKLKELDSPQPACAVKRDRHKSKESKSKRKSGSGRSRRKKSLSDNKMADNEQPPETMTSTSELPNASVESPAAGPEGTWDTAAQSDADEFNFLGFDDEKIDFASRLESLSGLIVDVRTILNTWGLVSNTLADRRNIPWSVDANVGAEQKATTANTINEGVHINNLPPPTPTPTPQHQHTTRTSNQRYESEDLYKPRPAQRPTKRRGLDVKL